MSHSKRAVLTRWALLAVLTGTLTSIMAVPASAQVTSPTTFEELEAAINSGDPMIVLGAPILANGWSLNARSTTHLDLNGFTLELTTMGLQPGIVFTVDDSSNAQTGTWNLSGAGGQGLPAISTNGATLVVDGGTINARTTGDYIAAIGGSQFVGGGNIIVNGGSVNASASGTSAAIGEGGENDSGVNPTTVVINGGVVNAEGVDGTAIGGGILSKGPGVSVTINGGVVSATASGDGTGIGAGLFSESYSVTINGGMVNATAAGGGAGIGGSFGTVAGSTIINGGVVDSRSLRGAGIGSGAAPALTTATDQRVEINRGTVNAASESGAGIGGGLGASIATISLGEAAVVTPTAVGTAVGGGTGSSAFGEVTIGGVLIIATGSNLTIPAGESLTVTETGMIRGGGSIAGTGSVVNNGIILNADVANLADGGGLRITGHDYKLAFDANYTGAAPIGYARVYAPTLNAAARTLPVPTRSGYVIAEWNTATDGSGSELTALTTLSADAKLYAQWAANITLSPSSAVVTAGNTQQFTVNRAIPFGTEDASAEYSYSSSNATDTEDSPGLFRFTAAGERTIVANLTADSSATVATTLTVEPAAAFTLKMTPAATTVDEGNSLTLELELTDAYGNAIPTGQVVITSDHSSDLIDGTTVTFPSASTHVLTARYGTLTSSVSITVIPASETAWAGLADTGSDLTLPLALGSLFLTLGAFSVGLRRNRSCAVSL